MSALISLAAARPRVILSLLAMLLVAGFGAFTRMPREAMPSVPIPLVFINVVLEGVSPGDSERLLVRPMEEDFQSLPGLKEMRATSFQGGASVVLEFAADVKTATALNDVRAAMDRVRPKLPDEIREPTVKELDFSQRAVLSVSLAADLPERTMLKLARDLRDRAITFPTVLDAKISGVREEQVEIVIDPLLAENYGLSQDDLFRVVSRSNRLVAAGAIESAQGKFAVSVPGLFENIDDIYNLPVKSTLDAVVKLKDVAEIRRTFKDRSSYVRVNGKPAVSVDITRRGDANVVELSNRVRALVDELKQSWPDGVAVTYPVDDSKSILERVDSLVNGVIASIIIVVAVCMAALGIRSGLIVGVAIPGSFLTGLLAMSIGGITLNVMALFGLILACGMLVDAAIVVVEAADKFMAQGAEPREAYVRGAQRMAWPIITSTLTTLAAFTPLLMWPGLTGKFFSYLPISVLCVLTASLFMALVFVPTLGAKFAPRRSRVEPAAHRTAAASVSPDHVRRISAERDPATVRNFAQNYGPRFKGYFLRQGADERTAENLADKGLAEAVRTSGQFDASKDSVSAWLFRIARNLRVIGLRQSKRPEPDPADPHYVHDHDIRDRDVQDHGATVSRLPADITGAMPSGALGRTYAAVLSRALRHPAKVAFGAVVLLFVVVFGYMKAGSGIVFFPPQEPDRAEIAVHARGNLSIDEQDRLLREVESRVLPIADVEAVYAVTGRAAGSAQAAADLIGLINVRLHAWNTRRPADDVIGEIQTKLADLPGIETIIEKVGAGPPRGGPAIQMEISANNPALLSQAVAQIRAQMDKIGGFINQADSRPLPGIEWQLDVDREDAARYGADIQLIGQSVQLVTKGLKLGAYRPDDSTEELDIVVRYPPERRTIRALDEVRIETSRGLVPISNFVERVPEQQAGEISRVDGRRVMTISADVAPGRFAGAQVGRLKGWFARGNLPNGVEVTFKGEQADSEESGGFLGQALVLALFLIAIILLIEFDSFFNVFLVLSAVVMSTIGVFLGLLIFNQPFSIVMTGIGVITLAGIVVNNNIILIDAFNDISRKTFTAYDAAFRTGLERMRPVLLTTGTTAMGLLPMALGMNIDFIDRTFELGAPSNQWWRFLAQAIIYGLIFSTGLTLIVTPCALLARDNFSAWWKRALAKLRRTAPVPGPDNGMQPPAGGIRPRHAAE
ncbi:MAG: efflux RND transporter permease subunit [Rhodobacteraceae bacterium]|nr:efflux RND transporter permease subunit [Paracoccaceae bacterium]